MNHFYAKKYFISPINCFCYNIYNNTIKKLCPALQKKRSDCGPSANFRDVDVPNFNMI